MRILLTLGFLHLALFASAQFYFYDNNYWERPWLIETGISGGAMNCLTDIGGRNGKGGAFIKDLNIVNTERCGGFFIQASFDYKIGIRLEATFGKVKAYDSILKGDHSIALSRYKRNLHFRSSIFEIAALIEFYPLNLISKTDSRENSRWSPYIIAGMALFKFNPQAQYEGKWVDLQPLRTEGQGFRQTPERNIYRLTQPALPLGLGLRYEISALFNLKLELNHRILFTDYLDDVSSNYIDPLAFDANFGLAQASLAKKLADRRTELDPAFNSITGEKRGNPANNDALFSLNLKVAFALNRKRRR